MVREITFSTSKRPAIKFIKKKLGEGLTGAEIGVNKGHNAAYMSEILKPTLLYLIDPWDNFTDPASGEIVGEAQYQTTKDIMSCFDCYKIIRKKSIEAVKEFKDGSLDFVYIDSDHFFDAVLAEIVRWHSKVKTGGIVSGHDFSSDTFGVVNAVNFFCQQNKIRFDFEEQDWWFIKK